MKNIAQTSLSSGLRNLPSRYTTSGVLVLLFLATLILCHCSKTVDITAPSDDEHGVSAQGTCVGCHSTAEMINLTGEPLPGPETTGGGG